MSQTTCGMSQATKTVRHTLGMANPTQPLPIQLPLLPEHVRASPNAFIRSALFRAGNQNTARQNLKRERVVSLQGYSIFYTGEELRQDDDDVYLEITHRASMHPLGTVVRFSAHSLLRELGWSTNGPSYERLRSTLTRLTATALTVSSEDGREGYTGSLIRGFTWQGADGSALQQWEILLEKEIVRLYSPTSYTRLEWKMIVTLPPLAKYLYKFFSSHETPYPYSVEKFQKLTGTRMSDLAQFRRRLKEALELLVDKGFLADARVEPRSDLVYVQKMRHRPGSLSSETRA